MSVTVQLKRPVNAHGEEVSELTLRLEDQTTRPAAVGVEIRQKVVGRYVSRLAQIPMSSVEALNPGDFARCSAAVMGFFEMSDGEETTAPSSD